MKKLIAIIAYGMLLLALSACTRPGKELEQVLRLAGENRAELEAVLEHYKHDPQKLEAARFLLLNMPGAFGAGEELVTACEPFLPRYDSLMRVHSYDSLLHVFDYGGKDVWERQVDSMLNDYHLRNRQRLERRHLLDLHTLTAQRLITEIDQAFEAWQQNLYTRERPFEEFCEYILPYRRKNGLVIDSARQLFYARHGEEFFRKPGRSVVDEVDSLLYRYRHITHSGFAGTAIPIVAASTFEALRHGLCEHRCWYNSLLFSSLGLCVAIDFVPAWGNRNNSHTWNVLIDKGVSYPFESFWEEERWKYKHIYHNTDIDKTWGLFMLPKVYRRTYRRYVEGPLADEAVDREDIPSLFREVRKRDVSHEYFDTVNLTVELKEVPEGVRYAYLCVLNYNEWTPVQWGKIEAGKAEFKGMGRNILYLPMYCKRGVMRPAGAPFFAGEECRKLLPQAEKEEVVIHHYNGALGYVDNRAYNATLEGASLILGSRIEELEVNLPCVSFNNVNLSSLRVNVEDEIGKSAGGHPSKHYARLQLPKREIACGSIEFLDKEGEKVSAKLLQPLSVSPYGEHPEGLTDGDITTTYRNVLSQNYLDFELEEREIATVRLAPCLKSGLKEEFTYELSYWKEDKWHVVGRQQGAPLIRFEEVPKGALLLLKPSNNTKRVGSRPFIYTDGEVHWL